MSSCIYDVVVIGGGVTGCSVARELSRYNLHTCLLEREEDVCSGTSKANSAIVHAGYDAANGSLKAKLNVQGNEMMEQLSKDLQFDFKRNGSMVLCFDESDMPSLEALYERGVKNGVPDLTIITGDEARAKEPNVSETVVAALYAPTGGIVCPFGLTIAMAENAYENGVEFRMNTEVVRIEKTDFGYRIITADGEIETKYVVNAAGVYADVFHNMVSEKKLQIIPRRGDYCLLDKEAGNHVSHTIFQLPGKYGKGVLVSPTVHGNLLVGPTAIDQDDKEATATTAEGLAEAVSKSVLSVKNIPFRQTITSFAGLRAHEVNDEFIIGEAEDAKGFYDAAGIESPGLSCAPALGKYLAEMIAEAAGAEKKEDFKATRKGFIKAAELPREERAKLIKEHPEYGTIICRCENISEGEIIDAIRRPLGAVSLDGIKRRVRAGMGRCQAGFCTPRTMEILAKERGISMEDICKNRAGSELLKGDK
ncbi:NAD(P)/FAD-dependent oxidoreductase [[Clostridium] symbiosum]|uniref:NAD(P)/FAD-dependent oxidoreductase n=1 Tax=Clostridium symbiosum TaxID=1512 RepID=UPI001D091E2E|nr:NAD(P)/FAD-dependent oxidoreductase [[Clostridium] symbiosum]MCB6609877.1 NAD(P)/FAD-dependent oxidoreductase [[Clostridium] symbiosum]MCB6932016.1 NAD(P)/FAD-dependent oxidoreductase [[Clostridium] symbiosum]